MTKTLIETSLYVESVKKLRKHPKTGQGVLGKTTRDRMRVKSQLPETKTGERKNDGRHLPKFGKRREKNCL